MSRQLMMHQQLTVSKVKNQQTLLWKVPETTDSTSTGTAYTNGTSGSSDSPYEGYELASDGYYYGMDGYYDKYGNFYTY